MQVEHTGHAFPGALLNLVKKLGIPTLHRQSPRCSEEPPKVLRHFPMTCGTGFNEENSDGNHVAGVCVCAHACGDPCS